MVRVSSLTLGGKGLFVDFCGGLETKLLVFESPSNCEPSEDFFTSLSDGNVLLMVSGIY